MTIIEQAQKFREQLLKREAQQTREMLSAYRELVKKLNPKIIELEKELQAAASAGEPLNQAQVLTLRRYQELESQLDDSLRRFAQTAAQLTFKAQTVNARTGFSDAETILRLGLGQSFNNLPTQAIETFAGLASDGSPLTALFAKIAPLAKDKIKSALLEGVAFGYNPRKIASNLRQSLGVPAHRALTIARTESLRAYRESTRHLYQQTKLVQGWIWYASLTTRTCAVCWSMHGSKHPLEESFASHQNCRCTMLPFIDKNYLTPGAEEFVKLSGADQRLILGPQAFEKYKAGEIQLKDLVSVKNDARWGKTRSRKPLKEIFAQKPKKQPILTPTNIKVRASAETEDKLKRMVGRQLNENEIGGLVGALDNATVKITSQGNRLEFSVTHPFIQRQVRTLSFDDDGLLYIHNDYFRTSDQAQKGTGLKSFATQASHAARFGVVYIETYAAGNYLTLLQGNWNGYYTWPRFGYNAKLTESDKRKLPEQFRPAKDLNELMKMNGKEAWKVFGGSRHMVFDLSKDSSSWDILNKYLQKKGYRV